MKKKGVFEQPRQNPESAAEDSEQSWQKLYTQVKASVQKTSGEPPKPVSNDAPTMQIPIQPQEPEFIKRSTTRLPELSQTPEAAGPEPIEPEAAPSAKKRQRPAGGSKTGKIFAIAGGGLVLALVLGMLAWGIVLKKQDKIYPNVYIADINVGELSRAQAMENVEDVIDSAYASSTLVIELPDRTISLTPDKTRVALDADQAVDAAMGLGREGDPFSAVTNYFTYRRREHYVEDLQVNLDTDYIRDTLEDVAQQVACTPSPTTAEYDSQREALVIDVGCPDRKLDVEALYTVVCTAFSNGDFTPVQWQYDEKPLEEPELADYFAQYCTPVTDAYYDEEKHTIVESTPGYGFDLEQVRQQIKDAPAGSQLVIPMADLEPKVTTEALEQEMFGDVLFETSSKYVNNANRTKNLTLACEAINGTILGAGEVFSFNDIVGERTAAKGYLPATVYNAGLSVSELGGGVCQVASTIYYATLHLNMEQVHREPHQYVVTYVPYGMDATVYWGHIDYQFRNTLQHPVRIFANTENGSVNITFRGVKETDETVEMSYVIEATFPWQEVEELDESKPAGYREVSVTPYTGYRVSTYKTILDANGKELSKKQEEVSTYSKRDQKVIVGPVEEAPPEDPVDPFDPFAPIEPEENPERPPEEGPEQPPEEEEPEQPEEEE